MRGAPRPEAVKPGLLIHSIGVLGAEAKALDRESLLPSRCLGGDGLSPNPEASAA
jgi:hypothetical protein